MASQKPEPTVLIELGDYASTLAGYPPDGFEHTIDEAMRLAELADSTLSGDKKNREDVFILAGLAHYLVSKGNPIAFLQRARQIVKWMTDRPSAEDADSPTSLSVLENKSRELSRLVASGLYKDEGFMLLIFHNGKPDAPGYLVHSASCDRRAQIKLLTAHLAHLAAAQDEKS